jgi:hypothetical protein
MFLGHWQFLRSFFDFVFLRYLLAWFAIVPVLVNVLQTAPARWRIGEQEFVLTLSLPFSWWLLWLASLSYFVAFALYHLFCPPFIKRYPSFKEYDDMGHSPRWIAWEFFYAIDNSQRASTGPANIWKAIYYFFSPLVKKEQLFDRVIKKNYAVKADISSLPTKNPIVEEKETATYFQYNGTIFRLASNPEDTNTQVKVKEIFWEVFGHFAKQGAGIRASIYILVGITLILVLITAVQHIWSAAHLFIK